ncbi:MAG: outer membrane beta-barrel protein [bacterium]|nr:outer membrane beta-barrel protein [bacterium]
MKIKHMKKIIFVIMIIFLSSGSLFAGRKDFFAKPQLGLWFGPTTPLASTADAVDTFALGVGAFFRYNTPFRPLKVGFDVAYLHYDSDGINQLDLVPMYFTGVYLLPLKLPVKFQLKGGAGTSWVAIEPDSESQFDLMFMTGVEMSFPAGRIVNIGLRIDYLYIFEGFDNRGGHVLNTGITLYFNI